MIIIITTYIHIRFGRLAVCTLFVWNGLVLRQRLRIKVQDKIDNSGCDARVPDPHKTAHSRHITLLVE